MTEIFRFMKRKDAILFARRLRGEGYRERILKSKHPFARYGILKSGSIKPFKAVR